MSQTVDMNGTSPAAAPLAPAVLPALASSSAATAATFVSQRTDHEAIDGVDRSFFLWLLAGLIAATAACGLIAMSAVLAIAPIVE